MSNPKRGEFNVESIAFINQHQESVDIGDVCVSFKLYESIFDKFCTAEMGIVDGQDLPYNYRFSGQEFVRISLKQKEGTGQVADKQFTIDKTFRLYAVEHKNRVPDKLSTQAMVLKLVEPRAFNCMRKRLSQVFSGSYDDILENILVNWAKIPVEEFDTWTETSPNNIRYIAPNRTVSRVIDHLVNNASQDRDGYENSMFFYNTVGGGFRFKPINEMFEDEFPLTFSMTPRTSTDLEDYDLNAEGGTNTQVLAFTSPQTFNTLTGTMGGAYASLTKVYDPVRKIETDYVYDMEETWKKSKHVSKEPLIYNNEYEYFLTAENQIDESEPPPVSQKDVDLAPNKQFDSFVLPDYTMTHSFDNNSKVDADEIMSGVVNKSAAKLERQSLLQLLNQHRVKITIPFRTDLSVGTIIKLNLPPTEPSSQQSQGAKNELDDQRYLITHICFNGSPLTNQGVLYIEGVAESYAKRIEDVKPLETRFSQEEYE